MSEELSRRIILSDKTGTLTQNGIVIIFIILCAMFVYGKLPEMEMKELHSMGLMLCCSDLMVEVAHQLTGRGS